MTDVDRNKYILEASLQNCKDELDIFSKHHWTTSLINDKLEEALDLLADIDTSTYNLPETLQPVDNYNAFFFVATGSQTNSSHDDYFDTKGTSPHPTFSPEAKRLTAYDTFEEVYEDCKTYGSGFWNVTIFGRDKFNAQVEVIYRFGEDYR